MNHLPFPPDYVSDQVQEAFYSLNFARNYPVMYANNVFKNIRGRFRDDLMYSSFLGVLEPTEEGVEALDSAVKFVTSHPKAGGLTWNERVNKIIKKNDLVNLNIMDTDIFEM